MVEVAERLRRSLAARRSAATKASNEALRQAQDRRQVASYLTKSGTNLKKGATCLRLLDRSIWSFRLEPHGPTMNWMRCETVRGFDSKSPASPL